MVDEALPASRYAAGIAAASAETILWLSSADDVVRDRQWFLSAFERRGYRVRLWSAQGMTGSGVAASVDREGASLVLQPETGLPLPRDLLSAACPTACFHMDAYFATERRVRWALLFDHVFVFHPGFDERYQAAGHPSVSYLPHAAAADVYGRAGATRDLDVGWVGRLDAAFYGTRRRLLPDLARAFTMNDGWDSRRPVDDVPSIYERSKIVVNIGADFWPQDANLRVFETMAAGALLITSLPSELEGLGFVPGRHFVGYENETTVVDLVRRYLRDDCERSAIAAAGRAAVLAGHTYDHRVTTILEAIRQPARAPARDWTKADVDEVYLDYYLTNAGYREALRPASALAYRAPGRLSRIAAARLGRLVTRARRKVG